MSERWWPAVGDAVETPYGPGEILGFAAEAQDGAFRWGGAQFVDGPYVVLTYADNQVRGYPYNVLRRQRANHQVSLFEGGVPER